MTRLLSLFGLMRVSEHEELTRLKTAALDTIAQSYCGEVKAATDWEAEYKQAVAVLEKQAGEIDQLKSELGAEALVIAGLHRTIDELRPDALAMRRKRQRDRDRRKGNG